MSTGRAANVGVRLASLVLLVLVARPALGDTVYPHHVLRLADTMAREIALLHRRDLLSVDAPLPEVKRDRHPRHVLQVARQLYEDVQVLRGLNGLHRKELPGVPVRRIYPRDVRVWVEAALSDLRALRSVYGVEREVATASLQMDIVPADVYARLQQLRARLRPLGLPPVMPNDVYRKALTLRREVELLGVWFGVDTDVRESVAEPGRTPEDVYRLAEGIIVRLRRIVTGSLELDILGGVAQPLASPETVEPADVLDLMHLVLAELNAVKAAAGIDDPAWLPGKQVGRTPSDVFGVLSQADSMLARIERRVEKS